MKPSLAVAALLALLAVPASAGYNCPDAVYTKKRMARFKTVCCLPNDDSKCIDAVSDYDVFNSPFIIAAPAEATTCPESHPYFSQFFVTKDPNYCCKVRGSLATCVQAGKATMDNPKSTTVPVATTKRKRQKPAAVKSDRTETGAGTTGPKYCAKDRPYFRIVSGKHYCCRTETGKTCAAAPAGTVANPALKKNPTTVTADADAKKLPLTPLESGRLYLTKAQYDALQGELTTANGKTKPEEKAAAHEALATKYRPLIKKNLKGDGATRYEAAGASAKKPEDIDAALGDPWGGKIPEKGATSVAAFGPNADIQLTEAEFKKLAPADQKAYIDARIHVNGGAEGRAEGGELIKESYFPVDLHNSVEAAKKKLGAVTGDGTTPGTPTPAKEFSDANLTADEMKLLTPGERQFYQALLDGKGDTNQAQLKAHNKWLHERIAGRTPIDPKEFEGLDATKFQALPEWKRRVFCANLEKPTVGAGTGNGSMELDNGQVALTGLGNSVPGENKGPKATTTPAADVNAWAKDPCAALKATAEEVAPPKGPKPETKEPPSSAVDSTKVKTGPDVTGPKDGKKGDAWYKTQTFKEGIKGAMLGALIGSFGGPVGAVVGAVVFGALFAGISKLFGGK